VAGEQAVDEEFMMDALEELALEEGGASSIAEGPTIGGMVGVGEAPATQVPSIDTLLGDIYELRYQLVQANSRMYRYRAERDRYH